MYNNEVKLLIDNDLVAGMEFQGVVINTVNPKMGILLVTEGMSPNSQNIILHIFFLKQNDGKESYSITHELDTFYFESYGQASQFIDDLPVISAIELLLKLNPPMYEQHSYLC